MLLIIDNNENIKTYFPCETEFLDASHFSLVEVLEKIKKYDGVEKIYFPLELKFKSTYRQALQGFELFKHIRLTPELGKIHLAPILLGYTYPLENILRNPESTILCSPATHLFHLKNIHQLKDNLFFQTNETVTKEILKPYILFTDNDTAKSEHDRRNEYGPLKLERELNGTSNTDINLDLWQKKLLFLQGEKKANEQEIISENDFKTAIKGKRILYLDDEADKWEKSLRKLFEGATIDIVQNVSEIVALLESINKQGEAVINEFKQADTGFYELRPQIDAAQLSLNAQDEDTTNTGNRSDELNKQVKDNIDAVKESIKKYTDGLNILSSNPGAFKFNAFQKNTTQLSNLIRHVRTTVSMLYTYQQAQRNIKQENNNTELISPEYLVTMKNFHSGFVAKLSKILDYDLIILDLRLTPKSDNDSKELSGISILKFLKSFNPYIPVLLFTASQNFKNRDNAKELNKGGAYWIKNVSHANDLKRDILRILVDPVVYEIYWKTRLILNKDVLEKYVVSNNGTTINREQVNSKDLEVIKKSLKYFAEFRLGKAPSIEDFWANTFKLNEARFTTDKPGQTDRPQLITLLKLDSIEHEFNKKRVKVAAHIDKPDTTGNLQIDEYELCQKYISYSLEWFLNYLPYKG
jgi:CheY-like chemotaxis protein